MKPQREATALATEYAEPEESTEAPEESTEAKVDRLVTMHEAGLSDKVKTRPKCRWCGCYHG